MACDLSPDACRTAHIAGVLDGAEQDGTDYEARCPSCNRLFYKWEPGGAMSVEIKCGRCSAVVKCSMSSPMSFARTLIVTHSTRPVRLGVR